MVSLQSGITCLTETNIEWSNYCWEWNPGPSEARTRAREKDRRSYDVQPVKGKEWICSRGTRGNAESRKK
jgi:hypothetical protein